MNVSHINEKVFYRFVEFTSRLIKYELAHEDYKLIALDKKEANTITEKKVKRLADSFLYLLNQTNQIIDLELVKTCYYLLTKKRLNKVCSEKIIKSIYLVRDDTPYIRAASAILAVYGLNIERKLEFAILLANYILIKNGMYPIILHEIDRSNLRYLLKTKSKKDLVELIYMHEYQTRHGIGQDANHNSEITIDYVIEVLKSHQIYLMNELKVKHVFLYGGLVKGSTNTSSDIDLLVDMGEDMVNYHKYEYINKIQAFLAEKIESKLDVLDFSYSLAYAEIKEMNNTIKIF